MVDTKAQAPSFGRAFFVRKIAGCDPVSLLHLFAVSFVRVQSPPEYLCEHCEM
jgi:hypothetical protein